MTSQAYTSVQQKIARRTLSVPVQSALYISLSALTIWTIYFTTYPAIHNEVHTLRHHTALVSCH